MTRTIFALLIGICCITLHVDLFAGEEWVRSGTNLMLRYAMDRVGIGITPDPASKLAVGGTFYATGHAIIGQNQSFGSLAAVPERWAPLLGLKGTTILVGGKGNGKVLLNGYDGTMLCTLLTAQTWGNGTANVQIGNSKHYRNELTINNGSLRLDGDIYWDNDANARFRNGGPGIYFGSSYPAIQFTLAENGKPLRVLMCRRLEVEDTIECLGLRIKSWKMAVPDYVFEKSYNLPDLANINTFVDSHHHLPGMPSSAEVKEKGVDLVEMNFILLKKVEELTLYAIRQEERIRALEEKLSGLER